MDFLERLTDGSLMPHGHCLLWRGDLLLLHVGGDALTVFSYFAIPPALLVILRKRKDLPFDRLFFMFAAFIFLCGITHAISILNVWEGYYFVEGVAKMSTGLISALTAIVVWQLLPQVLSVPSMEALITNSEMLKNAQSELQQVNRQLERRIQERTAELETIANMDPLTGTFRRHFALEQLDNEFARAEKKKNSLALLLLDLDDFKGINEEYGHQAGDQILEQVGELLNTIGPPASVVGRSAGEEFLVVLPDCNAEQARRTAKTLVQALKDKLYSIPSGAMQVVSCSAGVAVNAGLDSADTLLSVTEHALAQAKLEGKGRVVVAPDQPA
jgi:diguanylate cyclase (GGDEF)-like protein